MYVSKVITVACSTPGMYQASPLWMCGDNASSRMVLLHEGQEQEQNVLYVQINPFESHRCLLYERASYYLANICLSY